jgi:hypothetical protein
VRRVQPGEVCHTRPQARSGSPLREKMGNGAITLTFARAMDASRRAARASRAAWVTGVPMLQTLSGRFSLRDGDLTFVSRTLLDLGPSCGGVLSFRPKVLYREGLRLVLRDAS